MNDLISTSSITTITNPEPQETRKFLSSIVTDEDLSKIKPGSFNILTAPRGWGKTTFMFDDRILNFSRARKHVVYLVHTKNLRDSICMLHSKDACAFTDMEMNGWLAHRTKSLWTTEDDVNLIHVMCYQTFAALLRRDVEWLDDIDLIVWDEFDDIQQYYKAEIKKAKKEFPDLTDERLAALLQEGKHTSITSFIYQIQTLILEPARIRLLAISATPETAAPLFGDYVNYILNGRLNELYDARETIYIESISEAVSSGLITPDKNMCPWIYTPRVTDILRLAELFKARNFKVLTFWSLENPDWRQCVTDEIRRASKIILDTGMVPEPYNCVITNQAAGRGINVYDKRFQDWLCDSRTYVDIGQFIRARYQPQRKYILNAARKLIEFVREEGHFPACYYVWHNKDEIKELLAMSPIYDKSYEKQLTTWSAVKKEWGDIVEFEDRQYGRAKTKQYRIKGLLESK